MLRGEFLRKYAFNGPWNSYHFITDFDAVVQNQKQLLIEANEALIRRDAVQCYESGHVPCQCTLCKIKRYLNDDKK